MQSKTEHIKRLASGKKRKEIRRQWKESRKKIDILDNKVSILNSGTDIKKQILKRCYRKLTKIWKEMKLTE